MPQLLSQVRQITQSAPYYCCTIATQLPYLSNKLGKCIYFTCQKNSNAACEYIQFSENCITQSECNEYMNYYTTKDECHDNNCGNYGQISTIWIDQSCSPSTENGEL